MAFAALAALWGVDLASADKRSQRAGTAVIAPGMRGRFDFGGVASG